MQGYQACDVHSFAHKMQELRKDFHKLKTANSEKEVNDLLEKYEQFIEFTYTEVPWTRKFLYIYKNLKTSYRRQRFL
jgi:hypothetical protein